MTSALTSCCHQNPGAMQLFVRKKESSIKDAGSSFAEGKESITPGRKHSSMQCVKISSIAVVVQGMQILISRKKIFACRSLLWVSQTSVGM